MKKIFILAYSRMNVGDDLFVDILVNRYPNVKFYSQAIDKNSKLYKKNINLEFVDKNMEQLTEEYISNFSGFVYIGGSIFIEKVGSIKRLEKLNDLIFKCKKNNVPFFFISSNFGPYTTEIYKKNVETILQNATDTCFRDIKSYNEFKHLKTVRYCPDVVFSYNKKNIIKEDTVGISVINFKCRESQKQYETQYYKILINTILDLIRKGKEIFLFSFCKYEGDEETIDYIIKEIPIEYKEKVKKIIYDGDLDEFLNIYSKMEYMLCSRFHAMVLSHIFKQKKYIISYSNKIDNVIRDLNISDNFLKIEKIDKKSNINIEEFTYKNIEDNIKYNAEKQFAALDIFIGKA